MSDLPSIKGSVMASVIENLEEALVRGAVSREELEARLEAEDLELLEGKTVSFEWYDIRIYDRMNRLLLERVGGGDVEYYRDQGRKTAERLRDGGLYLQLEYLSRAEVLSQSDPQARFEAFGRDLGLLNTLSNSILNFSRWEHRVHPEHPDRYQIEVHDSKAMPESLCWRSEGFINGMATIHGRRELWRWDRSRTDIVLYEMVSAP